MSPKNGKEAFWERMMRCFSAFREIRVLFYDLSSLINITLFSENQGLFLQMSGGFHLSGSVRQVKKSGHLSIFCNLPLNIFYSPCISSDIRI